VITLNAIFSHINSVDLLNRRIEILNKAHSV
jgi:hypothetical protein